MEIKYNAKGADRKALVKAVSDITGEPSKYLGAPSFAYEVTNCYTITREGNLDIFDRADTKEVELLIEQLAERGFVAEGAENKGNGDDVELVLIGSEPGDEEEPVGFSIGIPLAELSDKPFDEGTLEKFRAVVSSKHTLFQKALGTTKELMTERDEDTLWFDWFDSYVDKGHMEIYSAFIKALYRFAESAVRITARENPVENEKYTMRTFLNRIGLSGAEYKRLRKELLKNLGGNSAHRYNETR